MTRILIADDNAQNLYLLESILKGNNFEVVSARNGASALDIAGKSPPDLIITDILMPVMDGFELCRHWKSDERLKDIPFIFYTATYTDPKDAAFAQNLGAERFVLKPQKPEILVRIVREVLGEAQKKTPGVSTQPAGEEMEILKQYNEVLFRKLEKKVEQLEAEIGVRRQIEQDLRESKNFLDIIIEQIPDMIFLKDATDLRFVRFNRAGEDLLGYSREEMIGKTDSDLFSKTDAGTPDEKDREVLQKKLSANITIDTVITRHRGERILHTRKIPILDEEGNPRYLLGISEDITDRKRAEDALRESEEKFRTVVENVPDFIVVHRDGKIIFINSTVLAITGYRPDEIVGQPISRFIAPEYRATIESATQLRNAGVPIDPYEADILTKSGSRRTMMIRGSRIEFTGVPATLTILTDITDRKRADERIRITSRKLALMTDVTYQDIQNKVTALRGYIELSKKTSDEQERAAFIAKDETILKSIHDLIQSTKDYQQMGLDHPLWIPVEPTVRTQFAHLSGGNGISLACDLHGLEIYAEPLIERVFFNLLQNALLHGKNVTRIAFHCHKTPEGVVLVCEDDGCGILPEEKTRIFERVAGGEGKFGLFFVREFLDTIGLNIVESGTHGRGARFAITIPRGLYRTGAGR